MSDQIFPIIINNSNLVSTSQPNIFRYTFPGGAAKFHKTKCAIDNLSMYFFGENTGESIEKVNRLWESGLPYIDNTNEKIEFNN